jgi:hypothetical protein
MMKMTMARKNVTKKMPAKDWNLSPCSQGYISLAAGVVCSRAWRRYIRREEGRYPFPAPAASLLCDGISACAEAYLAQEAISSWLPGRVVMSDVVPSAAEASMLHRPLQFPDKL